MRMRRIRNNPILRKMTSETSLDVSDLIYPLFVIEGENIKKEIPSLPGVYHFSIDRLDEEIEEIVELGIPAVILFGVVDHKDAHGSGAYAEDGIIQRACRKIKSITEDLVVITDLCMCEYTDHGHCGILDEHHVVDNDVTLEYLAKIAVSQASAGSDVIAPSDMMDFRVARIRRALDENGFTNIPIMSYAAKFASKYYGPFRDAAGSSPSFGDRKGYQMDFHNGNEALREIEQDLKEDADFIIVKPGLAYLDVLARAAERFNTNFITYNVSGEYAMTMKAIECGIFDESIVYENMIAMKRAGASMIITYHAKTVAKALKEHRFD
ncbi:MAG: porphobilinogen synthase [Peptoniphilus sp.]|nr:porphobilinogen synthase [Peptoniphilus sp.]MDD7363101.1 porphobilinogen synthase [Bacillota bacterium]MDY6044377.1 porphobilinogen synthase [Peptoniphilus sp.]